MGLFNGLIKVALSPLKGVKEVIDDVRGDNGDADGAISFLTLGTSSVLKGTAKGIKSGVEEIFDN